MKIKSKLQLLLLIPVCLSLFASLALYLTNRDAADSRKMERFAEKIAENVFELNLATDQYLLHAEERPRIQVQSLFEALGRELASPRARTDKERSFIESIRKNHHSIGMLFPLLVTLKEKSRMGEEDHDSDELQERIIGQLLTDLRQIVSDTAQLSRISDARLDAAQRWSAYSVLVAILISGMGMSIFSYLIGKSVLTSIKILQEGAESVAGGNLGRQVPVLGGDEIGRLSKAFNEMSARLADSYVSVKKLQEEIDERKRAEQALRESESRYRIVAENTYDWEFWSSPGGEYVYISPSCRRITGRSAEEFMGDPGLLRRIVHPEDLSNFDRHLKEEEGEEAEPHEVRFRVAHTDGGLRWIGHVCKRILDEEGRFLGLRGSNRDITVRVEAAKAAAAERRKAENAIRRSHAELELLVRDRTAELEIKNQELQEFSFAASHDLSEPLRKVQTFGSLLDKKNSVSMDEQSRDFLSRMIRAANRMQDLLDGLLSYSRVGTRGLDFRPVKLDNIVKDAADDLEVAIQEIGARVEIGPLPTVMGDQNQLRQVFQNLIANAVKYRRSEIKTAVKISAEPESDGNCRIFVEDNGIGFDPKHLGKIFQPFQRLHGRNEYSGIGMGLAICRKIVERHNGAITAKSVPGKGSTFIVTLPSTRHQPDQSPAVGGQQSVQAPVAGAAG